MPLDGATMAAPASPTVVAAQVDARASIDADQDPSHARDQEYCRELLKRGSKSFAFASRLLPVRVVPAATAFYAFCRVADDLVDESPVPRRGVEMVQRRLNALYAGRPIASPVDRAFARVVKQYGVPRALLDALVEGFWWDAEGRVYEDRDAIVAYSARVAAVVGVIMTLFMGVRDPDVLARASDLGVAMQLTNIARDVGEDAARGRLYLPRAWLRAEGIDPDAFLEDPEHDTRVARVVERLLVNADVLYARAEAGIAGLPRDCRRSIRCASVIYRDIGRVIRRRGHDSIAARAYTSKARKLWLALRVSARRDRAASPAAALPAEPGCQFLIDAVREAGEP